MSIVRKVRAVERLFDLLESEITSFQQKSRLQCIAGCGRCCMKADIESTPLEFLPFAFHLFLTGHAETYLHKLQNEKSGICSLFIPTADSSFMGACGQYHYRGLICRLFGYAASRNKLGQLELATCKTIKTDQGEKVQEVNARLTEMNPPIITDYYQKLAQIDFQLGNKLLPINQAVIMAIEVVLHHYSYRPFPKKLRRAA